MAAVVDFQPHRAQAAGIVREKSLTDDTSQIVADLPIDLIEKIDALAVAAKQDRAWIIRQAVEYYLAGEGTDLAEDAAGLAELEGGHFSELDDVLGKASTIIERAETARARRAG